MKVVTGSHSLIAATAFGCLGLFPHAGLAQGLDSLRLGTGIRLVLRSDSAVEGKLLSIWPPDSLRLRQALTRNQPVYHRDEIAHLDVAGNHGLTGVYLGLAVGTLVGYGICRALNETDPPTTAAIGCAAGGVVFFVPVFGLAGSLVPRWRRIF